MHVCKAEFSAYERKGQVINMTETGTQPSRNLGLSVRESSYISKSATREGWAVLWRGSGEFAVGGWNQEKLFKVGEPGGEVREKMAQRQFESWKPARMCTRSLIGTDIAGQKSSSFRKKGLLKHLPVEPCKLERLLSTLSSSKTWFDFALCAWVGLAQRPPLLQGIFPVHGSNPGLPLCRQILHQLSHQDNPRILEWVA